MTDNYTPGTRWRDKKTFAATDQQKYGYRLSGCNPAYIITATDEWVIYEIRFSHQEGAGRIGDERAMERVDFEEKYEPSCCVIHDLKPLNPRPCNAVIVPDEGVFVVRDGKVERAFEYSRSHFDFDRTRCTWRVVTDGTEWVD